MEGAICTGIAFTTPTGFHRELAGQRAALVPDREDEIEIGTATIYPGRAPSAQATRCQRSTNGYEAGRCSTIRRTETTT